MLFTVAVFQSGKYYQGCTEHSLGVGSRQSSIISSAFLLLLSFAKEETIVSCWRVHNKEQRLPNIPKEKNRTLFRTFTNSPHICPCWFRRKTLSKINVVPRSHSFECWQKWRKRCWHRKWCKFATQFFLQLVVCSSMIVKAILQSQNSSLSS